MKDNLGKGIYFIEDNKIQKSFIIKVRETTELNMGCDRHGRYMPTKIEYMLNDTKSWHSKDDIFFTEDDILKSIK